LIVSFAFPVSNIVFSGPGASRTNDSRPFARTAGFLLIRRAAGRRPGRPRKRFGQDFVCAGAFRERETLVRWCDQENLVDRRASITLSEPSLSSQPDATILSTSRKQRFASDRLQRGGWVEAAVVGFVVSLPLFRGPPPNAAFLFASFVLSSENGKKRQKRRALQQRETKKCRVRPFSLLATRCFWFHTKTIKAVPPFVLR